MANKRIKDLANTATSLTLDADQYAVVDGSTGTFKTKLSELAAWISKTTNLQYIIVTDNPEYLYAITDSNGVFLFGITKDGAVKWVEGVPEPIKLAFTDLEEELTNKINEKVDKVSGKSLFSDSLIALFSIFSDPSNIAVLADNDEKIIANINSDGSITFNTKIKLNSGIELGKGAVDEFKALFSTDVNDISSKKNPRIPQPKCAYVNFTNINMFPLTKEEDLHAVMEFYDGAGQYFKKNVILNAQGNSSLKFPKKNLSIDICNDDWIGDDTFKIAFGNWPLQDSYHFKAGWIDFTRACSSVGYDFFDRLVADRSFDLRYPWRRSIVGADYDWRSLAFGAEKKLMYRENAASKCHPSSFPCVVYWNGKFYGIYCFQTKKHRDIYNQDKKNVNEIHLDGRMSPSTFWSGSIGWTSHNPDGTIEIRNPKDLIAMDGTKLEEGDEPIDSSSASYDPTNPAHLKTAQVKQKIQDLADTSTSLNSIVSQYGIDSDEFDAAFNEVFDVDNLIDYIIFQDVTGNGDIFANWQWNTWDGKKWYVSPYDLDRAFGCVDDGVLANVITNHVSELRTADTPTYYVFQRTSYNSRLQERYALLRNKGVIDANAIADMIAEWVGRVGLETYEKEFDKWDCGCNRDAEIAEEWALVLDGDGKPEKGEHSTWDAETSYSVNDEVYFGYNRSSGIYKFKAISSNLNVRPISKYGIHDSLWRYYCYMEENIQSCDTIYNY